MIGSLLRVFALGLKKLNDKTASIGDFGTQFGTILAQIQKENTDLSKVDINDLELLYKQGKINFDSDPEFRKLSHNLVLELQHNVYNGKFENSTVQTWSKICSISHANYSKIYKILKISEKLEDFGESFYSPEVGEILDLHRYKSKFTVDENSMTIYKLKNEKFAKQPPLILVKSDGGWTYDTTDLACLKYRVFEEQADKIIYVTDIGQAVHFSNLFQAGKELGILPPDGYTGERQIDIQHVKFGLVLDKNRQKFKTRSGENIKLMNLLEQAFDKVEQQLDKSSRAEFKSREDMVETRNNIAISCIKFSDFLSKQQKDYIFDFDKMTQFQGKTGAYLLYSYLRCRRILEKIESEGHFDQILNLPVQAEGLCSQELNLIKHIVTFYDKLEIFYQTHQLNHLAEWLYNLAVLFTEFYNHCPVSENGKIHQNRTQICRVTKLAFENCFDLIGLQPVDQM